MSVIICRTCGLESSLPAGQDILCCPACGTNNCRPQAEHDAGDMLRRATTQRLRCDFKHAESSYQYVLRESPDEHEALWGLVQCRYEVEYVKDSGTGKLLPIVHGVQRQPMLTDPDFLEACELAPEAVREQYRREAMYIDDAMAKILSLAQNGDPYDIFLCHKTTRTDGQEGYTEDYNRAFQLYHALDKAGYRVFFAPQAALSPGENYEAGIYHALSTAKVMLVICSNKEHIDSPWVRTEWRRFLKMSYEPGSQKHLIPLLYEGFPPRRLPDDFRRLQAIVMGELDATTKLMDAVRKYVGQGTAGAAPAPVHQPVSQPAPAADDIISEYIAALMSQNIKAAPPAAQISASTPAPARPVVVSAPVYAPEDHFTTDLTDGGVSITGYTGKGGKVAIPPTIGGKKVVNIGNLAFRENIAFTSVTIPDGVTSIGEYAFYQCGNMTEVVLPASMTEIGRSAFTKCSSLAQLQLPPAIERIGACAFEDCTALREISIPVGVTMLDSKTFDGCSRLRTVNLPAGLTEIKNNVFSSCAQLKEISIPYGVTRIEDQLFCGCTALERVTLPDTVEEIGSHAFSECSSLTEIVLPEYVTIIENEAFYNCTCLKRVQLPVRLKQIGNYAFCDCNALETTNIPEDIYTIGEGAFEGCASLLFPIPTPARYFSVYRVHDGVYISKYSGPDGNVNIPARIHGETVVGIRARAFNEDYAGNIHIPETVRDIEGNPFYSSAGHFRQATVSNRNQHFYIQDGALYSSDGDLIRFNPSNDRREAFTIPYGIKRIREGACYGNSYHLKEVRIPASVTHIGKSAFERNYALQRVAIPESVIEIGERAFAVCEKLTELTLPQRLPVIKPDAFERCPLPAGVRMKLAFAKKK